MIPICSVQAIFLDRTDTVSQEKSQRGQERLVLKIQRWLIVLVSAGIELIYPSQNQDIDQARLILVVAAGFERESA